MRAAVRAIELSSLEVVADSESDDRGILGIDDATPAGPLRIRLRVRIVSSRASEAELKQVVDWGERHCPVSDAARRAVELSVEIATT